MELEAVHCLEYEPEVFQVIFEMFSHSGLEDEAEYVQLPSAGDTEKLASMVLDVAVVYLYFLSPYILILPVGSILSVPRVNGGWYS